MNNRLRQKRKLNGYTFTKTQVWNADNTMANFILALLKEYKKMKRHGYPKHSEVADSPEKWEAILDRLIYTFDQLAHDFPDSPHSKAYSLMEKEHPERWGYSFEKDADGNHIAVEKHREIYEQYITPEVMEKEKEYRKSIEDGLLLFARYFQDLWD